MRYQSYVFKPFLIVVLQESDHSLILIRGALNPPDKAFLGTPKVTIAIVQELIQPDL